MKVRIAGFSVMVVLALASVAHSQGSSAGRQEYLSSCASCHGATGKGDGPVAKALKKAPADLTRLTEANKGVFPFARIYNVIDGRFDVLAHGPRTMPVWGDIYQRPRVSADPPLPPSSPEQRESLVKERILSLIEYIASLQAK